MHIRKIRVGLSAYISTIQISHNLNTVCVLHMCSKKILHANLPHSSKCVYIDRSESMVENIVSLYVRDV